jgi:hypothetical protein
MKVHCYGTSEDARERISERYDIPFSVINGFIQFLGDIGHFKQVSAPNHTYEFHEDETDYLEMFCKGSIVCDCIDDVKAISPADVTEDTEAFRFGRAFHEGLENPNE